MTLAMRLIADLIVEAGPMAELRRRAAECRGTLVLPEAGDERVVAAALALRELELARVILVGEPALVRALILEQGADPGALEILEPGGARADQVAAHLLERGATKGMQSEEAHRLALDPVWFGAGLVGLGSVDAMVAGATHATAEILRAALRAVGPAKGVRTVSGSFLMIPPGDGRPLLLADSAIVIEPDEDQLVAIGLASARMWEGMFGRPASVAALSFSTLGSADHPAARKMARVAARLVDSGVDAVGELQADAALVEEVARLKAPDLAGAGRADVLLFPDLQSGNIAYKLVQRLGGYRAVGPLIQGLARPVFDLSRGCSAAEIVDTAAIALLSGQAGA